MTAYLDRLGPSRCAILGTRAMVAMIPARELGGIQTVEAVHMLVRYGVGAKAAKRAIEAIAEKGQAEIEVPTCGPQFEPDMLSTPSATVVPIQCQYLPGLVRVNKGRKGRIDGKYRAC